MFSEKKSMETKLFPSGSDIKCIVFNPTGRRFPFD